MGTRRSPRPRKEQTGIGLKKPSVLSLDSKIDPKQKRRRGRPRKVDRASALRAAMVLFSRLGYDGTSLSALTQAMNISRPTLYLDFGGKANLFRETLSAFATLKAEEYRKALTLPTAKKAADAWLRLAGGVVADPGMPSGCFLIQGALMGNPDLECLRDEFAAIRLRWTLQLRRRLERARSEGDIPESIDPELLAEFLSSLAAGLALQFASGVTADRLGLVVDLAMENWLTVYRRFQG